MTLVVVTGGAGFIGSHLATKLVEQGFEVRVLDNLMTGREDNLRHIRSQLTFIRGSVEDGDLCCRVFDGARYVWHLAALGSVPRSLRDPLASNSANVTGTLSVLWAARQMGVERVVFSSSSSVYGPHAELPQKTEAKPRPASPYAVTKLAGEHYLRVFYEVFGLETVSLRFFNVFGARQDPNSPYAAVIPSFTRALLAGQPGQIEGDGTQSRDFTYVADCIQACYKAMIAPGVAGNVYNVACGQTCSVLDLYGYISKILDVSIDAVHVEPRPGDVKRSLADISNTVADLKYEPQYTVESGLKEAIPWYLEFFKKRPKVH
ncbi:SDR family oxidoreductase [bacterium]|nr:SDR family oxidoreductase [bacterium]